jgi:ATP-binding cassette subfamily B (MDR/TAP) protein 1
LQDPPLPDGEKDPTKEKKDQMVSIFELFRFAESYEYLLLALGVVFAMVAGCSFPWFAYLWGKILDAFLYANDADARLDSAIHYRNIFFYVGVGALVSSWVAFAAWTVLSERMAVKCRKAYMNALLRQDVGWFDCHDQFALSAQFNADALAYQKATGEKIGSMFNIFAMFACGAAIAIAVRWTMALVIFASLPIIGAGCIVFIYLIHRRNSAFQELYEKADSGAHQALSSIKTVKAMNGEDFEEGRYARFLGLLREKVVKWALIAGAGTGLFFFVQYCAFSFGFWYGTHCVGGSYRCSTSVTGSVYTPGEVTIVFFALFVGSFNFMQLVPNVMAILEGLKAAKRLYAVIDLQPTISKNPQGFKKDRLEGRFVFEGVTFAYPKEKGRNVLKDLNLTVEMGQINAFVGESGCGKSTIVQLAMRFYDPDAGRITLDGHDLRDFDLAWLRAQIGYVGQEPRLFEGSVKDNVLIGKSNASEAEIRDALSQAEALEFVEKLPGGLNYNVGYAGSQLSGGQKQRIAIARAILRRPQILILDEATSALDRRNEKLIQSTLDRLSKGVTTLTIAHRIKTIIDANKIFVLHAGRLLEQGKFRELKRFKEL